MHENDFGFNDDQMLSMKLYACGKDALDMMREYVHAADINKPGHPIHMAVENMKYTLMEAEMKLFPYEGGDDETF